MSTIKRTQGPRVDLPTAELILAERGIRLFDEPTATRMMLAASLGLKPNAWQRHIDWTALYRTPEEWKVDDYGRYVQNGTRDHRGWPVPVEVSARVREIKKAVPGTKFEVASLLICDPVVRATFPGEAKPRIVAMWWRRVGSGYRVYLP